MYVVVDIGNSAVKLGVVARPDIPIDHAEYFSQTARLAHYQPPQLCLSANACRWAIAGVHREAEQWLIDWITTNRPNDHWIRLTHDHVEMATDVESRERLGIDRLCAAYAVNRLKAADRPAVFVDFGTATTVNAISTAGIFLGGAILPGMQTQLNQLSAATDQLPAMTWDPNDLTEQTLGKNTRSAIKAGCYWGHVSAVRGLVERIGAELSSAPQVWLTGGGMPRIDDLGGSDWPRDPELVLRGVALALKSIPKDQHTDVGR